MFDIGVQVKDTVCLLTWDCSPMKKVKCYLVSFDFVVTSIAYYIKMGDASSVYLHLHLHLVILQMLLSKATYNWGIHKAIILRGKQTEEVLVIPSFRHCSNKYKLEREGINKEKDKVFLYTVYTVYINLGWSQVFRMKSAFRLGVEDHSTSQERWTWMFWTVIWASLWWYHEASLTSGSQTSGGDVDS